MISSTSSSDRAARPELVPTPAPVTARPSTPRPDQISTQSATYLRSALDRQPEIRPEVVERGRALAADPHYPSASIIQNVAGKILASPDLSEDVS
jgi:hypothetical protein